jgi:hypothetical protein
MAAVVRTLIIVLALCGGAVAVYWKLADDAKQRTIDELTAMTQEMDRKLAAREEMINRLESTRRVGHLRVLDQTFNDNGGIISTSLEWIELDSDGKELARQAISVPGETVYVDAWSIKFPHDDVAEGHPLRGRTLLLLRRVYSDKMTPADGVAIDTPGAVPPAYAVSEMGEYQQHLWEHFWDLATDSKLARSMGVRVAQGEAVYKPVRRGQVYELVLDAVGGMSLVPIEESERVKAANASD